MTTATAKSTKMTTTCDWPRCHSDDYELKYLGKHLCLRHWRQLCRQDMTEDEVVRLLNIDVPQPPELMGTST